MKMELELARIYAEKPYDVCPIRSVVVVFANTATAKTCYNTFNSRPRILSSYFDHTHAPSTKVLLDNCLPLAVTRVPEPELLIWENQHIALKS